MIRNLKALGVVVAAVFALTAVAATGASAAQYHSEITNTTIKGEQTGGVHIFNTDPGEVTCATATFSGSQSPATSNDLTITPEYKTCHLIFLGATITMTVNMNGCTYTFTSEGATNVHLVCPEGKQVVVSGAGCQVTVPAQAMTGITYQNTGSGSSRDVDVIANVSGMKYSYSGFTCGSGSNTTNGTYKGTTTVRGFNSGGTQVGVWYE